MIRTALLFSATLGSLAMAAEAGAQSKPAPAASRPAAAKEPASGSKPAVSKEEAEAKRKGLVKFGEEWVSKEDLEFLKKGLVRHQGEWVSKEEKEKLDAGWKRHDTELIPPAEIANIEKGLFKVQGAWVTRAEADAHHASDATPWVVPSKHCVIRSTVNRNEIERLLRIGDQAYEVVHRLVGVEPPAKIRILLFGSIEAGNTYAQESNAGAHSSVWPGYLSENDPEKPAVALYDQGFAHLYVAHAVAHKYIDAVAVDSEKIPEWFAEGIASYVDRYSTVELRDWAIKNLVRRGGFSGVADVVDKFKMTADDIEGSQTRLFEAGLVVAYLVEAPEKADSEKLKKALSALKRPGEREPAIQRLISSPAELEKRIRKFAGLER